MAKKIIEEIKNLKERNMVREIFKSAHCRPFPDKKGYFIYYTDKKKNSFLIGRGTSRSEAWVDASNNIINETIKKIEV